MQGGPGGRAVAAAAAPLAGYPGREAAGLSEVPE